MDSRAGTSGLVIFDCDGVLVDSEPIAARVLLEGIAETGLTLEAEVVNDRFLGRSMASIIDILRQDYGCILGEDGLTRMRERLFAAFRADLKPTPGIGAVVRTLTDLGVPFCVASSSQVERIRLALEVTGLLPFFEGRIYSAVMVRHGKPAPDLFLHAARSEGCDPARCVVVEDSPAGVEAAHRAGMRVLGYGGGGHAGHPRVRAALEQAAPHATFCDMARLPDLLGDPGRLPAGASTA